MYVILLFILVIFCSLHEVLGYYAGPRLTLARNGIPTHVWVWLWVDWLRASSHPSGSRPRTFLHTLSRRKGTADGSCDEPIQADPTTQGWAPDLFGSQSRKTTNHHVAKPRLPSFLYSNVDRSSISVEGVPAFRWVRIRIKSVPWPQGCRRHGRSNWIEKPWGLNQAKLA